MSFASWVLPTSAALASSSSSGAFSSLDSAEAWSFFAPRLRGSLLALPRGLAFARAGLFDRFSVFSAWFSVVAAVVSAISV